MHATHIASVTIVTVLLHLFCLSKLEKQHSFKASVNLVRTEVGKREAILWNVSNSVTNILKLSLLPSIS